MFFSMKMKKLLLTAGLLVSMLFTGCGGGGDTTQGGDATAKKNCCRS
jgi:predicted small secreted protein